MKKQNEFFQMKIRFIPEILSCSPPVSPPQVGEIKGGWKIIKLFPAFLFIMLILVSAGVFIPFNLAHSASPFSPVEASGKKVNEDRLKRECRSILGDNQGCIIVVDLETGKDLVVLNPVIAYSRESRPGSLFKLVTAAALLERGLVSTAEKIRCPGEFRYMGKKYICSEIGGHGDLNLIDALAKSCSVYFYRISHRLRKRELLKTASLFGLGKKIPSGETLSEPAAGVCSPPDDPRQFMEFSVGDHTGIKITPYQTANILSIIASGKSLPGCGSTPKLNKKTLKLLRKGMEKSALSGTCRAIAKSGITGGGKTGTSTNERLPDKTHAWFIGYTPAKKPKYGVVVFLEDGRGQPDAVPRGVEVMKALTGQARP